MNDAGPTIGGYPLLDDGTPFPGGQAFASQDPVSQVSLVLRRYRGEWFAPAESLDGFHDRAKRCCAVAHPNLVSPLDVGFVGSDVYVVLAPQSGATLEAFVKERGPLSTIQAGNFARQIASALTAIHAAGFVHGQVTSATIGVADETATLLDFGLIPKRPAGRDWAAADPLATPTLKFLPPERIDDGAATQAGDQYGFGATLFFMLTGRAPYAGNSALDVVNAIANGSPAPLTTLRPDAPDDLAALVTRLLARNPAERPTASETETALAAENGEPVPLALEVIPLEPGNAFAGVHGEAPAAPLRAAEAAMTAADRARLRMWFWIGGIFWAIALILALVLASDAGCFNSDAGENSRGKRR